MPCPSRVLALLLAGAGALALSGCSGGSSFPSDGDFTAGECRELAPLLRSIDESARGLGDSPQPAADVVQQLVDDQDSLRETDLEQEQVAAAVNDVVVAVAVVRLRAIGSTYEPQFGQKVLEQVAAAARVCGADPP